MTVKNVLVTQWVENLLVYRYYNIVLHLVVSTSTGHKRCKFSPFRKQVVLFQSGISRGDCIKRQTSIVQTFPSPPIWAVQCLSQLSVHIVIVPVAISRSILYAFQHFISTPMPKEISVYRSWPTRLKHFLRVSCRQLTMDVFCADFRAVFQHRDRLAIAKFKTICTTANVKNILYIDDVSEKRRRN